MTTVLHRRVRSNWDDLKALEARGFTYTITGGRSLPAPGGGSPLPLLEGRGRPLRHATGGYRADLGFAVNSSWEANYCRYLNWLKANGKLYDWTYEPGEFVFPVGRGPGSFYRPDYELWHTPQTFVFQELKGYLDPVSITKLKRMQKYYPCFPVELIREQEYRAIARSVQKLIPHWE